MKHWLIIAIAAAGIVGWKSLPPQIVGLSKDSVRAQLKDPASAEFRFVKVCPANADMVEGDFRAANAFGAYTGFRHFYAVGGHSYIGESLAPIERDGKTYSYGYQLSLACYKGANPDFQAFHLAVASGAATPVP